MIWWLIGAIGVACAILVSSEGVADLWLAVMVRVLPRRKLRQ